VAVVVEEAVVVEAVAVEAAHGAQPGDAMGATRLPEACPGADRCGAARFPEPQ
jgi:hypothetical protein